MPYVPLVLGYLLICFFVAVLGKNRKMGFWGYFFGSILLTPVIGLLLVLASDSRKASKKDSDEED